MRKNKMMRAASALLVAVLLTTSTISGTFAKYVTTSEAKDEARVAKWGVELQVVGNLFGDTYKDTIVKTNDENEFSVKSNETVDGKLVDVVAPGTYNTGEGFTISLKGQPEVDGHINTTMTIQNIFLKANTYGVMIPVDAGVVTAANFSEFAEGTFYIKEGTNFKVAENYNAELYTCEDNYVIENDYYPVVYTLTGNTSSSGDTSADSLVKAADMIAGKLSLTKGAAAADTSITYTGITTFEANANLATKFLLDGINLSWAWAFGNEDFAISNNDEADTILGMLKNVTEGTIVKLDGEIYVPVVEYTDYCLDTRFELEITVAQRN